MRTILLLFLTLTAFGCGYSRPKQMTQSGIVPVVAAIMPASQMHGGSDFMLTVTGSNFNGNAVVKCKTCPATEKTNNAKRQGTRNPTLQKTKGGPPATTSEDDHGL